MKSKRLGGKYILRLDKGEEIVETLKQFCGNKKIFLGTVTGIGATNRATVGCFLADTKKYVARDLVGNFEIAPLVGNISTMNNKVYLHLHCQLSDDKQNTFGGHLSSAIVSATFEAVIEPMKGRMNRKFSKEIGLNLFDL